VRLTALRSASSHATPAIVPELRQHAASYVPRSQHRDAVPVTGADQLLWIPVSPVLGELLRQRAGYAAVWTAAFAIVLVLVRVAGAGALDRVDVRLIALVALAAQAASLVLLALARTTATLTVCSGLVGAGVALAYPALMSMAIGAAPEGERPEVIATATACFDGGYAASSLLLAVALQLGGYVAVYGSAAGVLVSGALALLISIAAGSEVTRSSV
jgi:MFS family permease